MRAFFHGRIAQLARVPLCARGCRRFESCYDYNFYIPNSFKFWFFTYNPFILPSREARQFFNADIYSLKYPIMQKKSFIEDEEVKMILRQLGFGAALGTAFLIAIYFGGLIAKLCSGM